jgi:hypothetical protein
MVTSRNNEQVKVLVRLYQGIYDLHRRSWINIVVDFTNNEHQVSRYSVSKLDIA